MSFTKVFETMLGSTIWLEDDPTRIVWLTLLLRADRDGIVEGSIPGLAHLARVTPLQCATALQKFLSPDEFSRTKDHEGRRIREVAGGWEILNHAMYRAKSSAEEVRSKNAERQRLRRKRLSQKKDAVTQCSVTSRAVAQCHDIAETETETETETKPLSKATSIVPPGDETKQTGGFEPDEQWTDFRAVAKQVGLDGSSADWDSARWQWRPLDPLQKQAATAGLLLRQGTDDPALKALPGNYLKRRMWERTVRNEAVSKGDAVTAKWRREIAELEAQGD